jgi:hypothetical protein
MLHSYIRAVCISCLASAMVMGAAYGANAQQDKMKACNAQAKEQSLSGDSRKSFMKTCLSADAPAAAASMTPQQQKMKTCNADAKTKGLSGADRKAFMKTCLSAQS